MTARTLQAMGWLAAVVLGVACAVTGWAQKPGGGGGGGGAGSTGATGGAFPMAPPAAVFHNSKAPDYGPPQERTPTFQDLQNKRYLEARLKQMVGESEKLLKLAADLNRREPAVQFVTRDDVHRVEEIEKLAHGVKWKMQLAVDGVKAQ